MFVTKGREPLAGTVPVGKKGELMVLVSRRTCDVSS
jgi:hypothetical protein